MLSHLYYLILWHFTVGCTLPGTGYNTGLLLVGSLKNNRFPLHDQKHISLVLNSEPKLPERNNARHPRQEDD